MGYVEDMRAALGTRPLLFVGAAAFIFDDKDRLLLIHRTDNGLWGAIGGIMELGESVHETVRREVREEVGLTLGDLELFGILSGPDAWYTYPNGDEAYTVGFGFRTRHPGGELRLDPGEVREARWFKLNALPDNMTARTRLYLRVHAGETDVPGILIPHG